MRRGRSSGWRQQATSGCRQQSIEHWTEHATQDKATTCCLEPQERGKGSTRGSTRRGRLGPARCASHHSTAQHTTRLQEDVAVSRTSGHEGANTKRTGNLNNGAPSPPTPSPDTSPGSMHVWRSARYARCRAVRLPPEVKYHLTGSHTPPRAARPPLHARPAHTCVIDKQSRRR